MANEKQTARTKIKTKLDISDASYDSILDDCMEQATPRLAPYLQYQLAEDTTVNLASGDDSFTLPVSTSTLQHLYARTATTEAWREIDLWRQVRNKVYINEGIGTATNVKILASRPFVFSDADFALLATDYPSAMLPLYLYSIAEFYTYLTGNKRKFNDYIQTVGVRTLDEMKDLITFNEDRATQILENEVSAEGQ